MTKKELLEKLKPLPDNAKVVVVDEQSGDQIDPEVEVEGGVAKLYI